MADIDPRLLDDCVVLGRLELCHVLLMNDAAYPWLILVPDRDGVREIYELDEADQVRLARESAWLSRTLARAFAADKMNVAALGNVVPQLHVHHVVRYVHDAAWPGPVWGSAARRPYEPAALARVQEDLRACLGSALSPPA